MLLLGLLTWMPGSARGAGEVAEAWELVARHLPADAVAKLRATQPATDREAAFAGAVVKMDAQPVTETRLNEAASTLNELARGPDEIARASAYLVGRLYEAHFFQPDFVRAAHAYEKLAARDPANYWAQLGLVKLAQLQLYALPEPASPAARVAAAEALLTRISFPELQQDLHIVVARGGLFHGQPVSTALAHLVAAEQIGRLKGLRRAELLLQLGELSRREHQWAQARRYFEMFLTENEVDMRCYTVRGKLAEIAQQERAAGEAKP